ncbi:MAG: Glu-tRNA(Gln) amidotransferase subunit GatE [Candidatus Aenigmarchaeota archaeon]|nr:Glu-tRNA(Gln) amidotransferase subunit GatE [Candidatus Aenigmarchaeota archaeon]
MEVDYKKLGLKVGFEIHFQLNTKHKLFCDCPTTMKEKEPIAIIKRKLHPVAGELGEVDIAAQYEYLRDREFYYEVFEKESCLIELDEEPPKPINKEALKIALQTSMLLNCYIPNEVQVMRKTVIDGSNTSGFQRTTAIGFNGYVEYKGKKIKINQVSLEEDACSLNKKEGKKIFYKLNRLGIPLIEVTTGIIEGFSPKEVEEIALKIGMIVKSTGKVKRGLGTIRQDVNISIDGGARVEIKGVQKLEWISKVIEKEVERQLNLLKIREEIRAKGITTIDEKPVDVTSIFEKTESKIMRSVIKKGGRIFAFKLPGFSGMLKRKVSGDKTLGKELADYAKSFDLKGLIHSDENLDKYKLTNEFKKLKEILGAKEDDAIVIIGEFDTNGKVSEFVIKKVKTLLEKGLEKEVRGANEDGTTRFTRPLPGSARMYPETDIPPVIISDGMKKDIKNSLPETLDKKLERFINELKIPKEITRQLIRSEFLYVFENILKKNPEIDHKFVATFITSKLKELKRKYNLDLDELTDEFLEKTFSTYAEGKITRDAIEDIILEFFKSKIENPEEIIEKLNLWKLDEDEVKKRIEKILNNLPENMKKNKQKVIGMLIGKLKKVADVETITKTANWLLN